MENLDDELKKLYKEIENKRTLSLKDKVTMQILGLDSKKEEDITSFFDLKKQVEE